jgi:hypothetical protein
MSSDDRITIGQADDPIDFGNANGTRDYDDDLLDIGRDLGKDVEWAGEAIGNTWESASDRIDSQTSEAWDSAKTDFADGNYLQGAGELGWVGLEDAGGVVAATVGTVVDAAAGVGAAAVAAAHDVYDAAADIGNDVLAGIDGTLGTNLEGDVSDAIDWVGDGVADIGEAVVDGVEDAIDAIGDLF